jgi:very-short-patch-repair endonuclease
MGFDVVRFSNEEVRIDIDAVCARILRLASMEN